MRLRARKARTTTSSSRRAGRRGLRRLRHVGLLGTLICALLLGPDPASATLFFVDVADDVGLLDSDWSFSANVGDFDADGLPDVMIARHEHQSELWRNVGGRFVIHKIFPTADHHDCAWGDVNVDGALDLYCTIGADEGKSIGLNELWIQNPVTRAFTNRATAYGVTDPLGRGRRTTFVNFNGDPYPDLFVGNDYPRPDGQPSPNRFFINDGGNRFVEFTTGIKAQRGANCAVAGDYDGDGWEDLLVCGKDRLWLYHNEAGTKWKERGVVAGVTGKARDAEFARINSDALLDIVRIVPGGVSVQYGRSGGTFDPPVVLKDLSSGREVAVGDADGDGRQDIYVLTGGTAKDVVLRNMGGGNFQEIEVPPAGAGKGDTAEVLDYNANGIADFIVLNGGMKTVGPTQILTLSDDPTEPDAPKLTATPGSGAVCLSWNNPWNGGSAITGYNVYRDGTRIAELGKVRSYRDTGVTDQTTYEYRVAAVNAVGEGSKSEPVSATPSISNFLECRG